jgi:hypothetical protein
VPAEFIADRIFVRPTLRDGRVLRLFTDSGGGTQFLFLDVAQRLGLPMKALRGEDEREKLDIVPIPEWREGAGIPPPLAIHQPKELRSHYFSLERKGELARFPSDEDGFLGQGWFGGRVWTFDYLEKQLWLHQDGHALVHRPEQEISIHLPAAGDGMPSMHFARITIHVDGEPIDLLFDTGATLDVGPAAISILGPGPDSRATSFIAKTVFDRWRARHPDWRVVEKAERGTGAPIIEVPRIRIATYEVGPVWFTFRPNENFHDFMSSMMDARVEGALGGSALRYFRVTVDFPRSSAIFQR